MKSFFFILSLTFSVPTFTWAQGCCSGGSASPIAGGTSQGVLNIHQMEIATSFQRINSGTFRTGHEVVTPLFNRYISEYSYTRLAYGVTKKLTVSLESGYYWQRGQYANADTIRTRGIGDLIIFPRYNIYNKATDDKVIDITLGAGLKLPLGSHNDSSVVFTNPFTGRQTFAIDPPITQLTTGGVDKIFYGFFLRGFPLKNFRLFANTIYIRKGWNSLNEKFGDYASVGLFASTTVRTRFGLMMQVRGEWVNHMHARNNVDLLATYNIDQSSTGMRRLIAAPQVSYTKKGITFYVMAELPIYEHVNGTQIGMAPQYTAGLSYRFFPR